MGLIKSVAWLYVENGKVLCVRTKGKDKFYIPGGKIDQGESPEDALIREIREELKISIDKISLRPAIKITDTAHGFNGVQVEMQCFFATHTGSISINSEIEEIKWMGADYLENCAPAAQKAVEFLAAEQIIRI